MTDDNATERPDVAPLETAPTPSAPSGITIAPDALLGALAAIAVVVGSIGPWVTVGAISVSGTGDGRDGVISLVVGALLVVLAVLGRWPAAAVVLGAVAAAVAGYDGTKITSTGSSLGNVSIGWGLILVGIGALGSITWGVYRLARSNRTFGAIGGLVGVLAVGIAIALGSTSADAVPSTDDTELTDYTAEDGVADELAVDDTTADEPTAGPAATDGLSDQACDAAGIKFGAAKQGPCRDESSGELKWVANRGTTVKLEEMSVRLNSIRTAKTLPSAFGEIARAKGTFVIANISFKNNTSGALQVDDDTFVLSTGDGTYGVTDDSDAALADGSLVTYDDLGSGLTDTGNVVFDVSPENAAQVRKDGNLLVYQPSEDMYEVQSGTAQTRIAVLRTYR